MLSELDIQQAVLRSIAVRQAYVDDLSEQILVRNREIRTMKQRLTQLEDAVAALQAKKDAAKARLARHLTVLDQAGMLSNPTLWIVERMRKG
jgi:septal ring factor EnvC (AmiA/AmiB activator)